MLEDVHHLVCTDRVESARVKEKSEQTTMELMRKDQYDDRNKDGESQSGKQTLQESEASPTPLSKAPKRWNREKTDR